MPHYKDGTQAEIGDFVKGKPYNTPHEVAGTLVSITQTHRSDTCNCIIAFIKEQVIDENYYPEGEKPIQAIRCNDGIMRFFKMVMDWGQVNDFEKIGGESNGLGTSSK